MSSEPPARTIGANGRVRLDAIEALRGVAASLVAAGHIIDDGVKFGVAAVAALAAAPIWNAGVDTFFVISGFIMIWTFGDRFGTPNAVTDFLIRRVTRIVPLYWLITALTAALVLSAPDLFDRSEFEMRHIILSMAFVPHFAPSGELLPIVGVGWTLNYEMLFYLVFAAGLLFRFEVGIVIIFAAMSCLFVGATLLGPADHPLVQFLSNSVMLEFLAGIGLGQLVRVFGLNRVMLVTAASATLLAALALPAPFAGMRFVKAGLPAAAVLAITLALYPKAHALLGRWASAFGAASYALYLAHTLVINVTKAVVNEIASAIPLAPSLAFGLYAPLGVALCTIVALLLRRHVELPMLRACRRFAKSTSSVPPAGPSRRKWPPTARCPSASRPRCRRMGTPPSASS